MIPGPYSICSTHFPEDSDSPVLKTLRFGYDSSEAAYRVLEKVASEEGAIASECCVIRIIEREEAAKFAD